MGRERQDYIDLQCSAKPHIKAFTGLVREICREVMLNSLPPSRAVNLVIRRWKSFWGKPAGQLLTEYEQMGLIGELLLVDELVNKGKIDAVKSWVGPEGFIHDFEFDNVSVEIKVTTCPVHQHVINGIEQLEPLPGKQLLLVSFLAQKVRQGGLTLTNLVARIIDKLDGEPEIYEDFTERLLKTGFNFDNLSEYEQTMFVLIENKVYEVADEFPCITRHSFSTPISSRIIDIRYTLTVQDMEHSCNEIK